MRIRFVHIFILFLIGFNFSCSEKCNYQNTDKFVSEYVDYFKSLDIKQREFLVKIKIDSSNSDYDVFRISTSAQLLFEDEIPNKTDIKKEIKIAYFTELVKPNELQKTKDLLIENEFYNKNDLLIDSNYPEWILLKRKNEKCYNLIKDTHFQDLSDILE